MRALLFFVFAALGSFSQNCCSMRSWKVDQMPAPPLITGIGNNSWTISTRNDSCQLYFNQGLRLIHCFWDFEAYRAFKKAFELDSNCVSCKTGIALVYLTSDGWNKGKARKIIEEATSVAKRTKVSQEESDLLAVLDTFTKDKKEGYKIDRAFGHLCGKYPRDNELRLLYVIALIQMGEMPVNSKGTNPQDSVIRLILKEDPTNVSAHHYNIHNLEGSDFTENARYSADHIAEYAPASSHIQHMPGHIYYRMGEYEKARTAFLNSKNVDSLYEKSSGVEPINNWNNLHNQYFLAFNDVEQGRLNEANKIAAFLTANEIKKDKFGRSGGLGITKITDIMIPWYLGGWRACIAAAATPINNNNDQKQFIEWVRLSFLYYAKGMKAFEEGNKDSVRFYTNKFGRHLDMLKKVFKEKDIYKGARHYRQQTMYRELTACQYALKGDYANAYKEIDQVIAFTKNDHLGDPPAYLRFAEETKVQMQLMNKDYKDAAETLKQILKVKKGSALVNYKLAKIYLETGEKQKAHECLQIALDTWKYADQGYKPLADAKKLLSEIK